MSLLKIFLTVLRTDIWALLCFFSHCLTAVAGFVNRGTLDGYSLSIILCISSYSGISISAAAITRLSMVWREIFMPEYLKSFSRRYSGTAFTNFSLMIYESSDGVTKLRSIRGSGALAVLKTPSSSFLLHLRQTAFSFLCSCTSMRAGIYSTCMKLSYPITVIGEPHFGQIFSSSVSS